MFGKSYQKARKNAGYKSAKAYAEHLGIPVRTYTNYEQDIREMPLELAIRISKDLGISIEELVEWDKWDSER